MKKIMNDPSDYVNDMLRGIYLAYPCDLGYVDNDMHAMVTKHRKAGKVAIATGGGSGHLPLFLGYIGSGMLDGCSIGEVFQSPSAQTMLSVTKAINTGAGVLYIFGNYGGDKMNFEMAAEMADFESSITVNTVIGKDDVSSSEPDIRRGVAGIFFIYKVAGAAADEMMDLASVTRIAQRAADNVRTMGVALSPCVIPRVGHSTFSLAEGEMEIGMGIHGEAGVKRSKIATARDIVGEMCEPIIKDLSLSNGDEVAVLINGLGATPLEEQFIAYRHVHESLSDLGIKVFHTYVGEFATSMEMTGMSISMLKLDDELKRLIAKPANTPFYKQFQY